MENKKLLCRKLRLAEFTDDKTLKMAYEKQKQTYELVMLSATDENIRKIAERKLKELISLAEKCCLEGITVTTEDSSSYSEIIEACYRLLGNKQKKAGDIGDMLNMLRRTEQSAENYYLQALLHLEADSGHRGCANALEPIRSALNIEPENETYIALHKGITDVITAKAEYEKRALEELGRFREEQDRRLKEEETRRRWQMAGDICCNLAQCAGTIVVGVFSCFCECMDGCC